MAGAQRGQAWGGTWVVRASRTWLLLKPWRSWGVELWVARDYVCSWANVFRERWMELVPETSGEAM